MKISFLLVLLVQLNSLLAQDTLPKFNLVKKKDGIVYLGWINDYGIVKQITIQRSTDSLKRFASIGTDSLPMNRRGLFIDKRAKMTDFYYRIYVQLPEGKYFYTPSKKVRKEGPVSFDFTKKPMGSDSVVNIKKLDSLLAKGLDTAAIRKMDSTIFNKPKPFVPSDYVFTDKKGNVLVVLPNAEQKNYSILFFDENQRKVLQIKRVQESNLVLERYNFYKSGWYYFEIKEGQNLVEKSKFLLPPLTLSPNTKNK